MGFAYPVADQDASFAAFIWYCIDNFRSAVGAPDRVDDKAVESARRELEGARANLRAVEGQGERDAEVEVEANHQRALEWHPRREAEKRADREKYARMLDAVMQWKPPRDHRQLKDFMIKELRYSLKECEPDPPPVRADAREYHRRHLRGARERVQSHEHRLNELIEEHQKRKAWIDALAKDVPRPDGPPIMLPMD